MTPHKLAALVFFFVLRVLVFHSYRKWDWCYKEAYQN